MAKKAKAGAPLVVQSKVKEVIKKNKMNCASDVVGALTQVVHFEVQKAVTRAKANGRKTVRAADF